MKHLHIIFCLFLCLNRQKAGAQDNPPGASGTPWIIAKTGVGFPLGDQGYKTTVFALAGHLNTNWQYELFYHHYFPTNFLVFDPYTDGGGQVTGGFDWGPGLRYFFHGKHSGRKSALFVGSSLQFGKKYYEDQYFNDFPPYGVQEVEYTRRTTSICLNWGFQWRFKHAVIEVSLPAGLEFSKTIRYAIDDVKRPAPIQSGATKWLFIPGLQLGFAL